MNKIFVIMAILLVMPFILAEEEIATTLDVQEAGITPDNPLYELDVIFERIEEFFNENSKLNHVKERLAEMRIMIYKNKLNYALKAKIKFDELKIRIKNETEIIEHKKLIDNLGQKISAVASVPEGLNEIQREEIKALIAQHKSNIILERERIKEIIMPLTGGCGNVPLETQQQCCEKWAIRNKIVKIACAGNWEVNKGLCMWKCES